jgi:SAM-dependent methyltransferase
MPNPSDVRRAKGTLRHTLDQLLLVDLVRYAVVAVRYVWYSVVRRRLRTFDLASGTEAVVATHTISHNLKGLRDLAVNRSHLLVRPLSVVECLTTDAEVLSIGPRSEGELFNLAAHGFRFDRIHGLDLISYSPKVRLGDMHACPFESNRFDAVVAGWVLAYSEDRTRAAAEIVRIAKTGAIVAVGVEYNPKDVDQIEVETGYQPGSRHRIASCREILGYFGDAIDHVYYDHTVASADRHRIGALCVIFSVKKHVPTRSVT